MKQTPSSTGATWSLPILTTLIPICAFISINWSWRTGHCSLVCRPMLIARESRFHASQQYWVWGSAANCDASKI